MRAVVFQPVTYAGRHLPSIRCIGWPTPRSSRPSTWQAALQAGWGDAQLAEVALHVAANVLTNYFNHLVGTELDLPAAPALQTGAGAGIGSSPTSS